jgi:Recombination endonuclease VII
MPFKDPEVRKAYKASHYAENKERQAAYSKIWYVENKEKQKAASKARYEADPKRWMAITKAARMKRMYALPPEAYEYSIIKQLNLCAICGEPNKTKGPPLLVVDHDHATGLVRGFLCDKCNRGLGYYNDSVARLRAAADYLEAHNRAVVYSAAIAKRLQIPTNI